MDPFPIKNAGVLLARVREAIEPILRGAGFQFEGRNDPRNRPGPKHLWIDYSREEEFASLEWNDWECELSLVAIDADGAVHKFALVGFDDAHESGDFQERVDQFIQSVLRSPYLAAVSPSPRG